MLTLLVSDLHLHSSCPETARLFRDFLAGPARRAQALYILGDLFDAWPGDDDLGDPFNAAVCAALKACSDAGVPLHFLPGNRDFLAGPGFAAATGATLLADETVVPIGGQPTLLLHGDTLCTDDTAYQDFRAQVRSPAWRREFLALPLAERKRIADELRGRSETEKRAKPMTLMDVNAAAVNDAFERHGVARMIHGHTHRQAVHDHGGRGRWVLGDWRATGNCLACAGDDWRFETIGA